MWDKGGFLPPVGVGVGVSVGVDGGIGDPAEGTDVPYAFE
jgi:hypothetical protein